MFDAEFVIIHEKVMEVRAGILTREDYWDATLVNPVFTRLPKFAEVFIILLHERPAIREFEEP